MAIAKNKTVLTVKSVDDFIAKIDDETKRDDCHLLVKIYKSVTGFDAKMWGPSIIGFGSYHYKYESGREGDMALACFSPRKSSIVLYISGFDGKDDVFKKLGKYKLEGGCLHIKKLEDIDESVLKKIIASSVKNIKKVHS